MPRPSLLVGAYGVPPPPTSAALAARYPDRVLRYGRLRKLVWVVRIAAVALLGLLLLRLWGG